MSSNNPPPARHLPQWSRVGRLGMPCPPRRLPANRLQPLHVAPQGDRGGPKTATAAAGHSDANRRVASLQKNIEFLQQQHKQTLVKLHEEVEYLRRENKELKYKMIMDAPKSNKKGQKNSHVGFGTDTQAKGPSQYHMQSVGGCRETLGPFRPKRGSGASGAQPRQLHTNPSSHPPHASNLRDCELIIQQLYSTNSLQSQEIVRYKALLTDIVLNKKITPENYNLTKEYLIDSTSKFSDSNMFPKLGLQTAKTTGVTLPALTQSISSTMAERQRRARAMHRGHVKATVR
ncbi:coiled-coil domain-containing protein 74A-like isoform X1 [Entelurus aequoreus]|uniref:coiled-coil domain-containing protein 74A-like isoform X1 n=2 Tax=Entelurus aequoreus TaxID=161455 RepID=UPI002B1E19A3|nr:coiled-coil domain-containing protein 74A-like isoform X1 [Entelurus aequoreus]XP_061887133.1 coiled-coil domain-containing protein 74A-like isoform X1 [Entelurus aequoreus]